MKKMIKNGLIAILVVLFALCLVSCGGNEPKDPTPDKGSGGYNFPMVTPQETALSVSITYSFSMAKQMVFMVHKFGDDDYAVSISYLDTGISADDGYFDYGYTSMKPDSKCTSRQYQAVYHLFIAEKTGLTKAELLSDWIGTDTQYTVHLASDLAPERNVQFTVEPTYAAKVLNWVNAH